MCLAQEPQRSDAGEAQTRDPSVSSQALYHWATALPLSKVIARFIFICSWCLPGTLVLGCSCLIAADWFYVDNDSTKVNMSKILLDTSKWVLWQDVRPLLYFAFKDGIFQRLKYRQLRHLMQLVMHLLYLSLVKKYFQFFSANEHYDMSVVACQLWLSGRWGHINLSHVSFC